MADKRHVDFLVSTLGDPEGRKKWLQYKLGFPGMDLGGAQLQNKDLHDYDFSDVDLNGASLFGANVSGADFSDSNLSLADLRRAAMSNCCLDRSDLSQANMQGVTLTDAAIEDANLSEARLQGADLIGADLGASNLKAADLRSACLKYTRLSGANLVGANVAEADLTGAVMDDFAPNMLRNFDLAIIDDRKFRMMKSRTKPKGKPGDSTQNLGEAAQEMAGAGAGVGAETGELFGADGTGSRPALQPSAEAPRARAFEATPPPPQSRGGAAPAPPQPSPFDATPPPPPPRSAPTVDRTPPPRPAPTAEAPRTLPPKREETKPATDSQPQFRPFVREETPPPKSEETAKSKARGQEKGKDDSKPGSFFGRLMRDRSEKEKKNPDEPFAGVYMAKKRDLETDEGCYKILGVKENASKDDITKAFRAKAKLFHPDRAVGYSEEQKKIARAQFELARKAHDHLKRRSGNTMSDLNWPTGVPRRQSPYDHTLDELVQIVKLNPSHESMVYNLAFKYYEAGKLNEAIEKFERVLVLNPHNVDAQHNLKALKLQKAFKI